ncbi:MAG TPA: Fic family protein [Bryobacteraceae bacterium]
MPGFPLYRTQEEKRAAESRNGAIQALAVIHHAEEWKSGETQLTPELIKEFQRLAINQIYSCAGFFRDGHVVIQGVKHQPPPHAAVPDLVSDMCAYVNQNWAMHAVHLSSYVMWRLNWIHPFFGGNGRTSRAVSYLILSAKLGFRLPGRTTIPDQIVQRRDAYVDALQKADAAWEEGALDVSAMEDLMSSLLAAQLVEIHKLATGKEAS